MIEVLLSAFEKFMRWVRGIENDPRPLPYTPPFRNPTQPPVPPVSIVEAPAIVDAEPVRPPPETPVAPPIAVAPPLEPEEVDAPPSPKRERKRSANTPTQTQPKNETFAELLENLDDTFRTMSIPTMKGSWLPVKDIRVICKLGVNVPYDWEMLSTDHPIVPANLLGALPIAMSASFITSRYDTTDLLHPRFIFALKELRLPPNVEQVAGTPYRFGHCCELNALEKDRDSPKRMFWVWCWMVVQADGRIICPNELRSISQRIKHRRRQADGSRFESFVSRQWQKPTIIVDEQKRDGFEALFLSTFRQLLVWWTSRDQQWSVGLRKDGKRATFSIAKEHTAAYFADRDKVIAVDGRAKKIVHYVREHIRRDGATVREHIRGLREFDWRGYHCHVIAPKLAGAIITNFPIDGVEVDANAPIEPDMLTLEQTAVRLADAEDTSSAKIERRQPGRIPVAVDRRRISPLTH